MIKWDLEETGGILQGLIESFGDHALSHEEKMTLCDVLAEYVQHVRHKYELTTQYYVPSEYRAAGLFTDDALAKFNMDSEACWVFNDKGELICSTCRKAALRKVSGIQEHSRFCPYCGKRMKFQKQERLWKQ